MGRGAGREANRGMRRAGRQASADQWESRREGKGAGGERTNGRPSRGRSRTPGIENANEKPSPGDQAAMRPSVQRGTRKVVGVGSRADDLSNPLWDELGHAPPRTRTPPPPEARRVARGPSRAASSSCRR